MSKQQINTKLNLYLDAKYDDYEYGDPQEAAKILINKVAELKETLKKAEELAGDFLAPGVKQRLKNELIALF